MKKYLHLFFGLLVLYACKESTNEVELAEVPVVNTSKGSIEVVDFSGLQKQYLEKESPALLVVNFWATWCKPCVKELPAFEELGVAFKDQGVEVILVSLDFPENIEMGVIPFIQVHGIQNKVVLLDDSDANSWIPMVSKEWSGAIPATLIIDRKGTSHFFEQSFSFEQLEHEVKLLL